MKFKDKIIPRSLFARFILIIILPIIIIQSVTAYIFYNRHWEDVTISMQSSVVGDMAILYRLINSNSNDKTIEYADKYLNIKLNITSPKKRYLKSYIPQEKFEALYKVIKNKMPYVVVKSIYQDTDRDNVFIEVTSKGKLYSFEIPRKRLYTPTTSIFISWMLLTSLVLVLIALTFAKNQIRAIIRLADASHQFGLGKDISKFKPEGALEVRKAGMAFLDMKSRIEEQINQTKIMLAGISHDLRTPITRIMLQLAFLRPSKEIDEIKEDLESMQHMINEYIQYVKNNQLETINNIDICALLKNLIGKFYKDKNITYEFEMESLYIDIRANAIKRAIANVIENGLKFGSKLYVNLKIQDEKIVITIEDNGPGIPKQERENIFKAFYKLDASRNLNKMGVGLGLAISKDIITQQGGEIYINSNNIKLPGSSICIILNF